MKNDIEFANRLIALRKKANLSQEELGKLAGVTRQSIINYERGGAKPKFKIAAKMAQILNVSINYLYLGELDVVPTTIKTYKDIILNFYALKESLILLLKSIVSALIKYSTHLPAVIVVSTNVFWVSSLPPLLHQIAVIFCSAYILIAI